MLGTPVPALCEARVRTGKRTVVVDVEREYLPRVIQCENGPAGPEALKALAVAARSYLYYTLANQRYIVDGTGDQVFGCGREPELRHREAVAATAGEVLQYSGRQVAGFYVAGALPEEGCVGSTRDPTATEHYVTYNEGRTGREVGQTRLGLRHGDNHANRGGLSQNGSRCLDRAGYDYRSILRYYYGDDIALASAVGPCTRVAPPPPGGPASRGRTALLIAAGCAVLLWVSRRKMRRRPKAGRKRRRRG